MQGIVQEINSAHQVKMRLAQEQQRFKQWADSMPIFVWTADNSGAVNFVSQMLLNYTGLPAEQLIANWLEVVHPDDQQHVVAQWLHCVQSGDPYSIEFRIRRHDGTYIWHLAKAVAEYDHDGNIEKWLGSAMAIAVATKKPAIATFN